MMIKMGLGLVLPANCLLYTSNIYTEEVEGIQVHKYGAHIFHTSKKEIWDYVNQFTEFNHFVNSPIAVYKDELYNLPFNMNTFHQLWGVRTPAEAKAKIQEQISRMHITQDVYKRQLLYSSSLSILESMGAPSAVRVKEYR